MRSLTAYCLSAALGLAAASPAWAGLTYTASGAYNLLTSSSVGTTAVTPTSVGSGQDVLAFESQGDSSIGIHAYSVDTGPISFGSRSSGINTYYATSTARVAGTVAATDSNDFSFRLESGQVGAFGSTGFSGGEFQKASLSIKLSIGGTIFFDEAWSAEVTSGGTVTASHVINPLAMLAIGYQSTAGTGYFNYGINGADYSINLAALIPNAQGDHDIVYEMVSTASGNITNTLACNAALYAGPIAGRGAGQVQAFEGPGAGDPFLSYCGAGAQSGDPFSLPIATPFDGDLPLPEPASLPLVAGALLAAVGVRRSVKR